MEFKNMSAEQLEARLAEIRGLIDADDADLDALETEVRGINEELDARVQAHEKRAALLDMISDGAGEVQEDFTPEEERKVIDTMEIRNTKEYIDAYSDYIKTGDDSECRALLTENVGGTVAVPEIVYDIVKTAWDDEDLLRRVRKAYLKGDVKVNFEISGGDATWHTEGGDPVPEEELYLGIIELKPQSVKKWISISDETYDLRGEAFLDYIYRELAHRIAKAMADKMIAKIAACGTVSTTTCVGVPAFTSTTLSVGLVAQAMGYLSDEARRPVVMMHQLTKAAFKAAQYAANFPIDPFEGLDVVINNSIASFSAADTGVPFLIVGDLENGALANFPNGEGIEFKFDTLSQKKKDLIEVLGREYVALEVIAPNHFVKVTK